VTTPSDKPAGDGTSPATPERGRNQNEPRRPGSRYAGAPVTLILTVVNVVVFLGELFMARSFDAITNIPGSVIMAFGGNYASATLYEGRVDTLMASCFLHFGILHLVFNLYALNQVGPFLERGIGSGRVAVLYTGTGIVASMTSTLYAWMAAEDRLSAGASGAVCGFIGAALVVGFRTQGWRSPLMRDMAIWLALLLFLGQKMHADNAAHIGGAVAGGLIALLWQRGPEIPSARRASLVGSAAVILLAGASVVYHDATRPFATLRFEERLEFADQALRLRRCDDAWSAVLAARRLSPRSSEVNDALREVRARCGDLS
jgi:rhomboid protease GluP